MYTERASVNIFCLLHGLSAICKSHRNSNYCPAIQPNHACSLHVLSSLYCIFCELTIPFIPHFPFYLLQVCVVHINWKSIPNLLKIQDLISGWKSEVSEIPIFEIPSEQKFGSRFWCSNDAQVVAEDGRVVQWRHRLWRQHRSCEWRHQALPTKNLWHCLFSGLQQMSPPGSKWIQWIK